MTPGSVPVSSKNYVFDPRPHFPFRIVAKRYWIGEHCPDTTDQPVSKTQQDALTLVFLHGSGAHKEHWEPTIQRLFDNEHTARNALRFHDMWALDMPNHGDSAILNEDALRWGYDLFSWEDYARGVHSFLAGLGSGVDVDLSKRTLALVGHSMGGPVSMLATTFYPLLRIWSLHLIEPFLLGERVKSWGFDFIGMAEQQRDMWPSSEDAFQSLRVHPALRICDERILKLFANHGLRPLPTTEYPGLRRGVTLKCTKNQEAATLRDRMSSRVAYRYLPHLLKEVPTHITYGTVMDLIPEDWQENILYIASGGISNFASVTRVPEAGHMILQTHPDAVADVIWKSLTQSHESPTNITLLGKL
ncbi:Alpha/beta hydrolase family domain containing protein [Tylopilus felleus]